METVDIDAIRLERCRRSFRYFLRWWSFKNRETGEVRSFESLWAGQETFASVVEIHKWVMLIKAGKLGATQLETAYDGWVARFAQPNARVHLFSRDQKASRELLRYVRFGLLHLPSWFGIKVPRASAGSASEQSMMFRCNDDPDDVRTIVSYPATGNIAIDQSATHSHVDELSHMLDGEAVWNSVVTTVAPQGSIHIVTRGAGQVYSAQLWAAAMATEPELRGQAPHLYPLFVPYDARPGRDAAYRQNLAESGSYTNLGLSYFLPETAEDALRGDEDSPYIPLERWDALYDRDLPPLAPGDRTPIVLGMDAGVTNDLFAVVAASRHPLRHDDVAIRAVKLWRPDPVTGRIDYGAVETWVRLVCGGGCANGHPRSAPAECPLCAAGQWTVPAFNVVCVAYDRFQLEDMSQRLEREGVVWMQEFDQGNRRYVSDSLLFRKAMTGSLAHNGDPDLREHIGNAKAKLSATEDSKLRVIKRSPERKIDAVVAASMSCLVISELNL